MNKLVENEEPLTLVKAFQNQLKALHQDAVNRNDILEQASIEAVEADIKNFGGVDITSFETICFPEHIDKIVTAFDNAALEVEAQVVPSVVSVDSDWGEPDDLNKPYRMG